MSYFIVISGPRVSSLVVETGKLVPLSQEQAYVARLESKLAHLDGQPSMLWDDGETTTSEEIVEAARMANIRGRPVETSDLARAVIQCARSGLTFRLWYAANDPDAFTTGMPVSGASEAMTMLAESGQQRVIEPFVMRPQPV
jgi:hypothetical protein